MIGFRMSEMVYWTMCYPGEVGQTVYEVFSEEQILKSYWDYWYGRMCEKFGKEHVDANYSPRECIDDWVIVHWAWRSDERGN